MSMLPVVPSVEDSIPPIIVLVDDDRDTLDMYSGFLEEGGMWVATANEPQEALCAVDELKPDVVITDVGFDGQPLGLELIQTLKANRVTQGIPRILISGRALEELPASSQLDADVCLEKPIPPQVLLEEVRQVLARVRTCSPSAQACAEEGVRSCPQCRSPLEWLERRSVGGAEYDYFRWCVRGCGLYCHDRAASRWVKLA